ncbi:MAG TPA: hypothetical protein VHL98_00200 [Microvirga sp.]|jgi:hypothetical protein|nr:hypothetical protein [Microvirga sp.]
MLRALSVALLVLVAMPAAAGETPQTGAVAQSQENRSPPQAPKRDCERRQEGVSA